MEKYSGKVIAFILVLFLLSFAAMNLLTRDVSFAVAKQTNDVSTPTSDFRMNLGLWCQSTGCFDSSFSLSDIDSFYNVTFGTGNFNSLEMFTPQTPGYAWNYGSNPTTSFADQVQELALDAHIHYSSIKMIFEGVMDYHYNGTATNGCNANVYVYNATDYCNPEYTDLRNFLLQDAKYSSVYALGVNWERAMYGCDSGLSVCNLRNAEGTYGNTAINNSINLYANMVSYWGKQFISYYGEPSGVKVNPGPNKNWYSTAYAASVSNYPNPTFDVGSGGAPYWTLGAHGTKPISGTSSNWIYIGIADGVFQAYNQPAPYYESQVSDGVKYPDVPAGQPVIVYSVENGVASGIPCSWTTYQDINPIGTPNPGCAPSGQWNSNSISWWFQQQRLAYATNGANSQQFALMGMDYINYGNQSGQALVYPNIHSPYKYWNSLNFECSVRSAESAAGLMTPSNVTVSYDLPCNDVIGSETTVTTVFSTPSTSSSESSSTSQSLKSTKTSTTVPITSTGYTTSVHATNPVSTYYVVALGFLVAAVSSYLTFAYTKRKRKGNNETSK